MIGEPLRQDILYTQSLPSRQAEPSRALSQKGSSPSERFLGTTLAKKLGAAGSFHSPRLEVGFDLLTGTSARAVVDSFPYCLCQRPEVLADSHWFRLGITIMFGARLCM